MNKEEIEDILEELHLVRPEILKPKAKKLFEAIMSIADERDELKKQLRTSAIFNEEDIRLDQTIKVFETLANILNTESCSYRYLIYDLLGFKKENYVDLIAGMSITNAIFELEELKKQLEEKNNPQIFIDTQDMEERYAEGLYQEHLEKENIKYKNQQKEFINFLENEKDRLARECSQIYEDSLGKTRLVNEDIFNEVDTILSKYKEIIGVKDER